jgi:hypothetical protein
MGRESKLKAVEKAATEPVALPTHLEPSDLDYQRFMLDKIRTEQAGHQSSINTWSAYLSKRYSLGPTDRVDETGTITRAASNPIPPDEAAAATRYALKETLKDLQKSGKQSKESPPKDPV